MTTPRALISTAIVVAMTTLGSALMARQELPPGPSADLTMRLCTAGCHGVDKFTSEHRSKSQWRETIETMKTDGAKGSDEEFRSILSYLMIHFGVPVKINKATAKQIDDGLELEPGQADAIVKFRDANGPFADLAALLKVPGLDTKTLTDQQANLVF